MKAIGITLLCLWAVFSASLRAQVSISTVNVNIQMDSANTLHAKYRGMKLPKGVYAGSAVAENQTGGTMYIGQGSILKALRDNGYPALSRIDARAVIFNSQSRNFLGFISANLPFAQKLANDTDVLIVSGALRVAPGVGLVVAGVSAALNQFAPDIQAQIALYEQVYDTDGIQNMLSLGPGASAVVTVIFDNPPSFVKTPGRSFNVPVPVVAVTGVPAVAVTGGPRNQ